MAGRSLPGRAKVVDRGDVLIQVRGHGATGSMGVEKRNATQRNATQHNATLTLPSPAG